MPLCALTRVLAESSEYEYGHTFGQVFWVVVLLIGIARSYAAFGKPNTNKKCSLGLMLVLIGWLAVFGLAALKPPPAIVLAVSIVVGVLVVAGVILPLIGFTEGSRAGAAKGSGIWAIIIGLILVGLFGAGVLKGLRNRASDVVVQEGESVVGERVVFEENNFTFTMPDKPWVKLNPEKFNPLCSVAIMRSRPTVFFIIVAEKAGDSAAASEEILIQVVKANMKSGAEEVRSIEERPSTLSGKRGVWLRSNLLQGGLDLAFVHWLHFNKGYFYQLVCWGATSDAEAVERTVPMLVEGFSQIDPEREVNPGTSMEPYRSERYGYGIDLSGSSWVVWKDRGEDAPNSDFGAVIGGHSALMVIPVHLMDVDANLDSVTYGLLQRMEIEYPSKAITDLKRNDEDGVSGYDFEFRRGTDSGEYVYRIRVRVRGKEALLIAGWVNSNYMEGLAEVKRAVESVTLDEASPPPPDETKFDEPEALRHALVMNDIGIFYDNARNGTKATENWRIAARLVPTNETIVGNYVAGLQEMGRPAAALDTLDAHMEHFPDRLNLKATRASLLAEVGRTQDAIAAMAELFGGGYQNDEMFQTYGDLLSESGEALRAIEQTREYLKRSESVGIVVLLASLYGSMDDHATAVSVLKERQEGIPLNAELAYALADHLGESGLHHEAIATCDSLIEAGYDTASAYYLKGYSLYELKWYREAKDAFEKAHARAKNDTEIKSYLDATNGMLGQGENLSVRTPIEKVDAPAELFSLGGFDPEKVEGYRSFYLWRVNAISYRSGKELRSTTYRAFKVLSNAAVSEHGTYQVSFDPLSEQVFVNSLTVKDEDGAVVSTSNADDYYVVDDTSSGLATQDKVLHVPIRGLEPGHVVEAVVTRRDLGEAKRFRFHELGFSKRVPVARSAVYVCGEVDAITHLSSGGVAVERSEGGLTFVTEFPKVYRSEEFAGDWQEAIPVLRLFDSQRTWRDEVREYLSDLEEVLAPNDEIEKLAAEVFADAADRGAKLHAAVRHVRDRYSYKGIEFGRRAMIPRVVTEVVESKYGDCKDHALLLCHLLRSAGIEAHLALANTSGPVIPSCADLDQFDHMIVYVGDEGRAIDCTSKYSGASLPVPPGLVGRRVLVLDPAAESPLVRLADCAPDVNQMSVTRSAAIEGDDLIVQERVTVTDYYSRYARSWLSSVDPANRPEQVQRWMTGVHIPVRVETFEVDGIDDPDEYIELRVTYRVLNAVTHKGGRSTVRLPLAWEREYLSVQHSAERLAPLKIPYPLNWTSTFTLRLPEGETAELPAAVSNEDEATKASWSLTYEQRDGSVEVKFTSSWRAGEFPAEAFAPFQKLADLALEALSTEVRIVPME